MTSGVAGQLPRTSRQLKRRVPSRVAEPLGLILAVVVGILILAFALWYTSSGQFPEFPNIQNDYIDQGNAFLHGQLSLLERPDPRLADLGDPYEYTQRKGIPYHWDASYYDNKYYLYWGPVPTLVASGLRVLTGTSPAASVLVVLPFLGLMAVAIALLRLLSESFGGIGRLTVWLFVLAGFFNLPMLFTIGQPRHYQASILYGQFFLLLGVLGVVQNLRGRGPAWLGLSGLTWGFAIGSRYNLAISVAAYCVFLALWWRSRRIGSFWGRSAFLLVPLALCLLGLGLYNFVRFGDPMETGLSYQLTIPEFRQIRYSVSYVPSGLFAYVLYPLTGASTFPFMQAPHFRPALLPPSVFVPSGREFDQIILGLLPTVPAIWLAAADLPFAVARLIRRTMRDSRTSPIPWSGVVFAMLGAGAAGQFLFLLLFFYVAERYLVDFYVPVMICLAGFTWYADVALHGRPRLRTAFWVLVALLVLWTAAIGYFGCFGVPVLVSIYYDARLIPNLAAFWNERAAVLRYLVPVLQ